MDLAKRQQSGVGQKVLRRSWNMATWIWRRWIQRWHRQEPLEYYRTILFTEVFSQPRGHHSMWIIFVMTKFCTIFLHRRRERQQTKVTKTTANTRKPERAAPAGNGRMQCYAAGHWSRVGWGILPPQDTWHWRPARCIPRVSHTERLWSFASSRSRYVDPSLSTMKN